MYPLRQVPDGLPQKPDRQHPLRRGHHGFLLLQGQGGRRPEQLLRNGKWFTPLREALTAFAMDTQKYVTGQVKLKLYKGNIITSSVSSPCTLYSESLVTFDESDYDQAQATGFINLWGLPDTVQALREQGKL